MNFSLRNIIIGIVVLTLAVAIPVTVRLSQQQTQLKSKAAGIMEPAPTGLFPCNRPDQFQVGDIVGRCGSADANGCFQTGYARYTDNTLDINGDSVADPNNPGDQPQCDVNCTEPKQCPTATCPTSGNGTATNCGQLTYDRCDTSPCRTQGATSATTFSCSSSVSSVCTGTYQCGSCAPPPPPPSPPPTGVDGATCGPITIDGRNITASGNIAVNQAHNAQITINHPDKSGSFNVRPWDSSYSLNYYGSDANKLGLTTQKINIRSNVTVTGTSQYTFSVEFTPNEAGLHDFFWEMRNPNDQQFGGQCSLQISIVGAGGPGASPPPGGGPGVCSGSVQLPGDIDPITGQRTRFWQCQPPGVQGCQDPDTTKTCPSGQSCYACFQTADSNRPPTGQQTGQCGICQGWTCPQFNPNPNFCPVSWECTNVSSRTSICTDRTPRDQHVDDLCIETTCYSPVLNGECKVCWGSGINRTCEIRQQLCPVARPNCEDLGLTQGSRCTATTGGFEFDITPPSSMTITKGLSDTQCPAGQSCRGTVTVNKRTGTAQSVTLSTNLDTGGATAHFNPPSCTPTSGNCTSVLTFDATDPTGDTIRTGTYSPTIQGESGGITGPASNPFNLTINPPGATVTCFVVSTSPNTRSLFKNCNQVTNLNNPSGSVIAGFLDSSSQTFDFTLSAGNGSKTLFARFLNLPQGGELTAVCTRVNGCIETTAGITLNAAAPSPSPSPPPPPVTGCACQADNTCPSPPCRFNPLTDIDYADPVSCVTPPRIHNVVPNTQDKNSYCNRQRRTEGDANADGKVEIDDYLYYLTAVSGGKVPVSVNPDFDGNGDVGPNDLTIWERTVNQ